MSEPLEMDARAEAITQAIDLQIFDWLIDTAQTATEDSEVYSLMTGALAGVCRFYWVQRHPGTTVDQLVELVSTAARTYFDQADAHHRSRQN